MKMGLMSKMGDSGELSLLSEYIFNLCLVSFLCLTDA